MRAISRFTDIIVSTSVFTAFCALGLCMATERLVISPTLPLTDGLHLVVFGGTLAVYNLPRLLPNPYGRSRPSGPLHKWYHLSLFSGLVLLALGLPALPLHVLVVCGILGVFALAYFLPALPLPEKKRLRDYGILKIVVLTAVWTAATAILPMLYLGADINDFPFELLVRFVFVFALCILFDIRDMQTDLGKNISTLPNRIGAARAYSLVYVSLLLFLELSIMQHIRYPVESRLFAAVMTAIITACVAIYVRRNPGHKSFVALTDGMMLLYAVLVIM